MDARSLLLIMIAFPVWCSTTSAQVFVGPRSIVQSPNFRVYARSPQLANEVARAAEENRKKLAIHWLGAELPPWPEACPIAVNDGANTPASGETKYTLVDGGVANFKMSISGTPERILDSVLPHEITHTVMASHFAALGKPVPRWADEGACTTVEHQSERSKHDLMLVRYISEGRGIPFAVLFSLKDYPRDIMPLYAQGYSLSCFLICQGGPRRFVKFLEVGMESNNWVAAVEEFYQYPKLGSLQLAWNDWVSGGGGLVDNYTADALGVSTRAIAANSRVPSTLVASASMTGDSGVPAASAIQLASGNTASPVRFASESTPESFRSNQSMDTSSSSFYLEQFRLHQASAPTKFPQVVNSLAPSSQQPVAGAGNAIPQTTSLPAPFQTIGGGYVRR